jgi:hypothetical protein
MPNDLPEIPELTPVTRRVAELSHELAEELHMVCCERCCRYYAPEQMMRPGTRFRGVCDVYLLHPTCRVCAEESR